MILNFSELRAKFNFLNRVFSRLLLLMVLSQPAESMQHSRDRATIIIGNNEYILELARTRSQRSRGLMFRKSLSAREGMLFIYPESSDHRIWMKNTLIPLTVIWVDENELVIGTRQLSPCTAQYCHSYGVPQASKFIIELKAGISGIELGNRISGLRRLD